MISGENIATLIAQPEQVAAGHIEDLTALIEKYPYCSSLYILQLKGLSKSSSVGFEQQLKVAASHVSDREHLFFMINPKIQEKVESEEDLMQTAVEDNTASSNSVSTDEIEVKQDDNEASSETKTEENATKSDDTEDATDKIDFIDTSTPLRAEKQDSQVEQIETETASEVISEDQVQKKKEETSDSSFEEEIEAQASSANYEAFVDTSTPLRTEAEEVVQESTEEITSSVSSIEEKSEIEVDFDGVQNVDDQSISENASSEVQPEHKSFVEWLKYKQTVAEGKTPKQTSASKEKTESEQEKTELTAKETESKSEKKMSKKEINHLLDKFIEEEPTISRPTKAFFSPSESAKKSLEESEALVSETLAKIHMMQGNYGKAIDTYKKLSLLYPEKSTFFASQIEKIKEKQSGDQ